MKKYRERIRSGTFFIYSGRGNNRIHDFIKGWGTVSATGKTILWDTWTKPKKSRRISSKKLLKSFESVSLPMAAAAFCPELILTDILSVQPMSLPNSNSFSG